MAADFKNMKAVDELKNLVDDLRESLTESPEHFVSGYDLEIPPLEVELIYSPREAPTSGAGKKHSPAGQEEEREIHEPPISLKANQRCTLCDDRLYPVKRYRLEGRMPLLILHYNGPFGKNNIPGDYSDKFIFGSRGEDELAARMFEAAGFSPQDPFYQQYPACHFNSDRSLPEDWNRRCENCLKHVVDTVKESGVRALLVTGASAIFLLGEEKARELARSGEILTPEQSGIGLPVASIRSPAALLALEHSRRVLQQNRDGSRAAKLNAIIAEEKRIKSGILATLKRMRSLLQE